MNVDSTFGFVFVTVLTNTPPYFRGVVVLHVTHGHKMTPKLQKNVWLQQNFHNVQSRNSAEKH